LRRHADAALALVWVSRLEIRDLRNLRQVDLELGPGLNVLVGRNAQGKTSVLEAVGLLARGRSFRTEEGALLVRRGPERGLARGVAEGATRAQTLEVEIHAAGRRLRVDGRALSPRAYAGHLNAVVYSTDRLRVVHGPMRERRQFLDRGAA